MQRIVVAAKAGADEPWLGDAAANLAEQTGAELSVVSVDGVDIEMGSPLPRSEYAEMARKSAEAMAGRIRGAGFENVEAEVRPGKVTSGVLLFAEERDADLILVGASKRGPVAKRLLGDVSLELVSRSRRPVMVIAPPSDGGESDEQGGR
jgi:nucleotide-binding universal stress UspA family protein